MKIPEMQKAAGSGYVKFGNGDRCMVVYRIDTHYDKKRNIASATGEIEYPSPGVLGRAMIESVCHLDIGHPPGPVTFSVTSCQGKTANVVISSRMPSIAGADPGVNWEC